MTSRRTRRAAKPQDLGGSHTIDTGNADIVADERNPAGWSVIVNGVPSSYIDVRDPTNLDFEYMQWMGHVIDAVTEPGTPITAAHIGGAGCTIPLYVAATRVGSRQTVFEIDGALVTLARQAFGLRGVRGLRIKTLDGRAGVTTLDASGCDVVIRDAFDGSVVPRHMTTVEFARDVARVVAPGGMYVANVADNAKVWDARSEAAAAQQVFDHVALIAEPGQLRGRRYGNVVLLASDAPLPEDVLVRRLASGAVRARFVPEERVSELTSGVAPPRDNPPSP